MMHKTHLAFGILSALVVMPFVSTGNKFIFFFLVLFGSLLPDVDTPNSKMGQKFGIISKFFNVIAGHRTIFHSIFFAIMIPGLAWYFWSRPYGVALFVGYLSHLIMDSLTKSGINFLHPISTLRVNGFVETGSFTEKVVLAVIVLLILVKII